MRSILEVGFEQLHLLKNDSVPGDNSTKEWG